MADHDPLQASSTTEGLPVATSMGDTLQSAHVPPHSTLVDSRVLMISALAIAIAALAALTAEVLMHLIAFFTNVSFFGRASMQAASPAQNHLGAWVIAIPVIGGIIVGLMARFGSKAIRGHGIPEAMEQVLTNQSRIPARVTFLKPISAAISIGTGGPFGAEGPIIATGGALGSLIGQLLRTTAMERKVLLAAGAAAGMAATFGCPVSALILAIELLLFEYRPRSVIPVALACVTAAGIRIGFDGSEAVFAMPDVGPVGGGALAAYAALGAIMGVVSVGVTRAIYGIEDAFEHLPIHWMWWPALGGLAVGLIGWIEPNTLGVGYNNIVDLISNKLAPGAILMLCALKFVSWAVSLGSGTSGGTLAPLLTIGSGAGALLGVLALHLFPQSGVDLKTAALVGMAALFAGASRAWLASIVFAFETTHQTMGLLPLLAGCAMSFLVSCFLMKQSIMTEKIARRGVRVPTEYQPDFLDQILVCEMASKELVSLRARDTLETVRAWLASGAKGVTHQGFPVLNEKGHLVGVVTRRDLLGNAAPTQRVEDLIRRPPVVVYSDCTLRAAADHMLNHNVGRLPVIVRGEASKVIGMITRSDLLAGHRQRLNETQDARTSIKLQEILAKGKAQV
ncbi:MAG TPA: chloride channel protein [Planctomycetota bacterium]|nr:chloride channel protein [Planctomycetota bacterium]